MAVAANPAGTNLSFGTGFRDHLDTRGLTFEELRAHQCPDNVLLKLSERLDNWDTAGLYLEILAHEIKAIKVDNGSEESRKVALLNKWKQKNGDDATYYNLIAGLRDADRSDIADQALDCLKKDIIEIRRQQEIAQQEEEERQKEERQQQEIQLEYEMKENFLTRMKSKLLSKGLDIPDLQVYLRQEDVDSVAGHITKDWYKFGKIMKVEESTLDHVKALGGDKLGRKKELLKHLITEKVRFEDIIYGLYDSANEHDPFINGILEYLFTIRIKQPEESSDGQNPTTGKKQNNNSKLEEKKGQSFKNQNPMSRPQDQSSTPSLSSNAASAVFRQRRRIPVPWQAKFDERRKKPPISSQLMPHSHLSDLTPAKYQEHFYSALWLEEDEHIKKLSRKCDGVDYKLTIYDQENVPLFLTENPIHKYRYGYISGLSDDKIEYAAQASDNVAIWQPGSSTRLCIAFKHTYNFNHLENRMYIVADHPSNSLFQAIKKGTKVEEGSEISISAQFIVKYSYFDHLHHAVVKAPQYVLKCLLPDVFSFGDLFLTFDPRHSDFRYMELDKKHQLKALEMIVSESSSTGKPAPPVILYGPFGTGKTRILARAAFEVMMNGVNKKKDTRILISAHHEISITTFINAYFGVIDKKIRQLPFKVILITKQENKGVYADMYMRPDEEFAQKMTDIRTMSHVIIITTYTMSLKLQQYLYSPEGFFTHIFLDEAAQVREPEAITPLALATKDAKIVLAGDTQQVGPNILVLGEEAKKFELNVSLLQRLLMKYEEIGSVTTRYITKLSVNYRSHNSLIDLPNLFYEKLELNTDKKFQKCSGPTGYKFVSADSRLVEQYDDPDQQGVEACIILEEVRSYLERMKQINPRFNPRHDVCIITSTRKQLNRIRSMAFDYNEYKTVRKVSFKPSFMIQGHEFRAIFLSLFELVGDDEMNASYIKSLFNPYVFNTVITRAKFYVVAIGSPEEVKQFELGTLSHPDRGGNTTQCWHEYLKLCERLGTICNISSKLLELNEKEEISEFISLEDELPALSDTCTLSPDEIYDLENIDILNDKLRSVTDKLVAKDKEVTAMKATLNQCQEELIKRRSEEGIASKIDTIKEELSQCKLEFKSEIETSKKKFKDEIASIEANLEGLKEKNLKDKDMYAAKLKRENEALRSTMQTIETNLKEKDIYAVQLKEENEALRSRKNEISTELSQFNLSKEKLEIDSGPGFRAPSTVKVSKKLTIGLMYTIFILLLVATSWKPDPKTFTSSLPGVKVIASNRFLVAGGQSSQLHWEEYGLMLDIPSDALPCGFLAEVVIRVSVSGPYVYPDPKTWKPASAVYWISSSKEFVNPVLLGIWHNVKGSVNSSSIKILTAEDTPQNMAYIFNEFLGDFSVKGSYVYFKLTSFSGKTASTISEVKFQGTLFCKKLEAQKWDYSLVIYRSQVKGVVRSLLHDAKYEGWSEEMKDFSVIFEENSTILELNITTHSPVENWEVQGRLIPLRYYKNLLQSQENIESNMQFMLYWSGSGPFLVNTYLIFSLKGAEHPTAIIVNPSTNHNLETESKDTKFNKRMKQELDIKDLKKIVSVLKDSSFDNSKWEDLGLNLGLFAMKLNTIRSDNFKDSEACLKETLKAWLYQADDVEEIITYDVLVDALEKIDQKSVAEKIKDHIRSK